MHTIVWEFRPAPGKEAEFVAAYDNDGAWVQLFRRGTGYLGTELIPVADGWCRTIDRWDSEEAYRQFRRQFATEYAALDRACEVLTQEERPVSIGAI